MPIDGMKGEHMTGELAFTSELSTARVSAANGAAGIVAGADGAFTQPPSSSFEPSFELTFGELRAGQSVPMPRSLSSPILQALRGAEQFAVSVTSQMSDLSERAVAIIDSALSKLALQTFTLQTFHLQPAADLSAFGSRLGESAAPMSIGELNNPQLRRSLLAQLQADQASLPDAHDWRDTNSQPLKQLLESAAKAVEGVIPQKLKDRLDALSNELGGKAEVVEKPITNGQLPVNGQLLVNGQLPANAARLGPELAVTNRPDVGRTPQQSARPLPYSRRTSSGREKPGSGISGAKVLQALLRFARFGALGVRNFFTR